MKKIAGIRFKKTGKIYYFDPEGFELKKGMNVIVDTAMGEEFGEVVIPFKEVDDDKVTEPLKKVIRIVNDKDRRMYKENNVDYLSDDRYRMSKYNYLDDMINQRCYLYYEAGNLYAKDLNSGLVTQVRFPGQVYKSMPEQFIYDLNSVDSHSLTQQEKENIYKEYFEICGRLQNQEKVYQKK